MESAPSESALIPTRRMTVLSRQVCANRDKNCEGEAFYSPNNVPTFHPCGASAYYSEFDHNFKYSPTMYSFPRAAHDDLLNLEALLTPAERDVKNQARAWAEKTVAPVIADYWERAAFPFVLVPELAKVKTGLGSILSNSKGVPSTASPAAAPTSLMAGAMAMFEMGRVDASLGTFFLVHGHLACNTIALMGSQNLDATCPNAPAFSTSGFYDPTKPKNVHPHQYLLEDMCAIKKVGCWALTEPGRGSDASAVETTATPCVDSQGRRGYKLNGSKRWIGNGTWADASCIWAKNTETGQVNCFLVPKGAKGLELTKIENKIALRCVQNADMKFVDCFVPEIDRLPGATSFKDTSRVLAISRVMVAWLPVAMAAGAYDFALRYVGSREQFGSSIASYQLVQERLARMLAIIQSCWLMCWRVTRLLEDGKLSHAAAAAAKAHCTKNCREAVGLGREILGGNGILSHFHLAKVYCDMEAIYTYEGTYDVNVLVVGRDVTGGVSAFKNKHAAESQAKKKAQK